MNSQKHSINNERNAVEERNDIVRSYYDKNDRYFRGFSDYDYMKQTKNLKQIKDNTSHYYMNKTIDDHVSKFKKDWIL